MNGNQPPTIDGQATHIGPNGQAPIEPKVFSAEDIQRVLQGYRQGFFELKAERDAKQEQLDKLQEEIDELDGRIRRTEGAALGMVNLLNPPQEQQGQQGQQQRQPA